MGVIEYTEQLTYLLFLKMAHERATRELKPQRIVPEEYSWQRLLDAEGTELVFGGVVEAVDDALVTIVIEAVSGDLKVLGAARAVVDLAP